MTPIFDPDEDREKPARVVPMGQDHSLGARPVNEDELAKIEQKLEGAMESDVAIAWRYQVIKDLIAALRRANKIIESEAKDIRDRQDWSGRS